MDALETGYKHIVCTPGFYGGKPCIDDHKIAVHDIAAYTHQGMTPEALAKNFHLTLGQIHAALSYYYDHQEQIDREIALENAWIKAEAARDTSGITERMRQALAERRKQAANG